MKLGYDLTIEQSQKLVMTPELIQAIQILQFNTQELESYVEEQLLTNPILESDQSEQGQDTSSGDTSAEGEVGEKPAESEVNEFETGAKENEFDWAEHFKEREYDDISYKQHEYSNDKNEYTYEHFASSDITLTEHLMFQLQFAVKKTSCRQLGKYIIEALDENGYLTLSTEEIARQWSTDEEKVLEVLEIIQSFEPSGVGARSLQECLILQLIHNGQDGPVVRKVIENHLEDIAGNRIGNIAKVLSISTKEAQEASDLVKSLEPKPGRQFAGFGENRYIVPDVTVEKVDDEYIVLVNESSAPRLNISRYYQKLLIDAERDSNLAQFLNGRLNSALWLIKSIEQRKQTIYNVVKAVVNYQKDFFDYGPKYLKTLTLKQIADEVGIHESTVSRSVNGKYMQTPRGMFEIRYFFTSGVSDSTGGGIASGSIKAIIKEIVESEDPKSPYSDQAIVGMLKEKGIDISRRTVAKYREEMHLPSSSKRKRY